MNIKIFFDGKDEFDINISYKKVNGFVNKLLGENNPYHGKFSKYSVSRLQNGMYLDGNVIFTNGAFLTISSCDNEFIDKIVLSLTYNRNELYISNLKFRKFEISEFDVHSEYDIIRTTSPIRLQTKDKFITFEDDEFVSHLRDKSIKKLIYNGLNEKVANTLDFELFHPENAKIRFYNINGCKNICSQVMLLVRGNKEARKLIYELGLGSSTGFGFGSVKLI